LPATGICSPFKTAKFYLHKIYQQREAATALRFSKNNEALMHRNFFSGSKDNPAAADGKNT
jgi:hypothetical protein